MWYIPSARLLRSWKHPSARPPWLLRLRRTPPFSFPFTSGRKTGIVHSLPLLFNNYASLVSQSLSVSMHNFVDRWCQHVRLLSATDWMRKPLSGLLVKSRTGASLLPSYCVSFPRIWFVSNNVSGSVRHMPPPERWSVLLRLNLLVCLVVEYKYCYIYTTCTLCIRCIKRYLCPVERFLGSW